MVRRSGHAQILRITNDTEENSEQRAPRALEYHLTSNKACQGFERELCVWRLQTRHVGDMGAWCVVRVATEDSSVMETR